MDRALWIELLGAREMVCATSGRRASRDLQVALQLFLPPALTVSTDESCRTIRADVSKGRLHSITFFALDERAAFAAPRVRPSHSRARSSGIVLGEYLVALLISDCPARRSTPAPPRLTLAIGKLF